MTTQYSNLALLRVPTLPLTAIETARFAGDSAQLDDVNALREHIRRLLDIEAFATAVAVANPDLEEASGRALRSSESGVKDLRDARRLALALTAAFLRQCSRATPFGLYAGVGSLPVSDEPSDDEAPVEVVATTRYDRPSVPAVRQRIDGQISQDSTFVEMQLRRAAPLHRVAGRVFLRREVLPERDGGPWRLNVSVAANPVVDLLLEATTEPVTVAALASSLQAVVPGASEGQVFTLLRQLVEIGLLVPVAQRALLTADQPHQDASRQGRLERSALKQEPRLAGPVARPRPPAIADGAGDRRASEEQIDLALRLRGALPPRAARAAVRLYQVLKSVTPGPGGSPGLDAYHDEFAERYGVSRVVPLVEVVDRRTGIGVPAFYSLPLHEQPQVPADSAAGEERRLRALGVLLARGADSGAVVLDDTDLRALAGQDGERPPPPSSDIYVHLFARSRGDIAAGRFTLAAGHKAGTHRAGATAARFAYMLGDAARQELAEVWSHAYGDDEVVDLWVPVKPDAAGNVNRRPALGIRAIDWTGVAHPDPLELANIGVWSDGTLLHLRDTVTQRPIKVHPPTVANRRALFPPVARLLIDLSANHYKGWQDWDWSRYANLPRLPRVTYDNLILSRARWLPDARLGDKAATLGDVGHWRSALGVPRRVVLLVADNAIPIDLDDALQGSLLLRECSKRPDVVIVEDLQHEQPQGWLQQHGQPCASEIVIHVRETRGDTPAPRPLHTQYLPSPRVPPLGDWLAYRVYTLEDDQDAVLLALAELATHEHGVEDWHFVRYRDLRPHLRVRFRPAKGSQHAVSEATRDMLASLNHLIRDVVVGVYEPEVYRYGGSPSLMARAETVFSADADALIESLRTTRPGGSTREDYCAVSLAELAGLRPYGRHVLSRLARRQGAAAPQHAALQQLNERVPGFRSTMFVKRTKLLNDYLDAVEHETNGVEVATDVLASVLHMSCNRALGTDRLAEAAVAKMALRLAHLASPVENPR